MNCKVTTIFNHALRTVNWTTNNSMEQLKHISTI